MKLSRKSKRLNQDSSDDSALQINQRKRGSNPWKPKLRKLDSDRSDSDQDSVQRRPFDEIADKSDGEYDDGSKHEQTQEIETMF